MSTVTLATPTANRAWHRRDKLESNAKLCAELERMEAQFDDILTALENPNLTEQERRSLQDAYARLSRTILDHQRSGHEGQPCFEE